MLVCQVKGGFRPEKAKRRKRIMEEKDVGEMERHGGKRRWRKAIKTADARGLNNVDQAPDPKLKKEKNRPSRSKECFLNISQQCSPVLDVLIIINLNLAQAQISGRPRE
uniref:Uncharacterized protein n=1 Tax=Romanomermis culicivorax TaxID=13658 RepID=A0A915IQ91_ROMCU